MFKLVLNNFRSFQNEEFDFSRVNILIGENSSGKSSLLKFLLALKQSLDPPNSREYNFTFRGEYTDLGNYRDAVFYSMEDMPISFKFTFDKKYNEYFPLIFEEENLTEEENQNRLNRILSLIGKAQEHNTSVLYVLKKQLNKHETIETFFSNDGIGELKVIHSLHETKKEEKIVYVNETCTLQFKDHVKGVVFEFTDIEFEKNGFMSLIVGSSLHNSIKKTLGISSDFFDATVDDEIGDDVKSLILEADRVFYNIAFLIVSQNYLRYLVSKIDFINPINTKPSRFYVTRDEQKNNLIRDIEDVVDFLGRNNEVSKEAFKDLNRILKQFGLTDEIELIQDDRLPVKELKVKIKDLYSNVMDVGYGVVLQIPIIFKALLAERIVQRRNSIIIIEQPEVHLHPKLHAAFIDTLLSLGQNNIYFIETHSEHIIRKLQLIVKNKLHDISKNDISINYLVREDGKSVKTKHSINDEGILTPSFPSGFFDNSYLLSLNLLG